MTQSSAGHDRLALVYSEGISLGHVVRPLAIAQWLREAGFRVVVACRKEHENLFAARSLRTIRIVTVNPAVIYRRLAGAYGMYLAGELLEYFRQDKAVLDETQPDLVVSDYRVTAVQLARARGIPTASVIDGTCHPAYRIPRTMPDSYAQPRWIPVWWFDRMVSSRIGSAFIQHQMRRLSQPFQQASERMGLPVLATFFDYTSNGDACLIADHPMVVPLETLRPHDVYTGPLPWMRDDPLPATLRNRDAGKSLVYVAAGTQESLRQDVLLGYVRGLLDAGLRVVFSKGMRQVADPSPHPNLVAVDFINESMLLPLADLHVHPGGAMSAYQAMASGTPMLLLPVHANQHFYAHELSRLGVARWFRPSRISIDQMVRRTMETLGDKCMRERCECLSRDLGAYDGKASTLRVLGSLTPRREHVRAPQDKSAGVVLRCFGKELCSGGSA